MPNPEELLPEELAEIQRQHEIGESFRTTEAKPAKKAGRELSPAEKSALPEEIKPDIKELYKERLDKISEANQAQGEIDQLEAAGIKDRIDWSAQLRESAPQRQEALTELQQRRQDSQQRLDQLEPLVKGVPEASVSPQLSKAIQEVRGELGRLDSEVGQIQQELIQAEQVTDPQIERYQVLNTELDTLNQRIDEISSDPQIIERMYDEAKTEDQLRDKLIGYVLGISTNQGTHHNPERDEFLRTLCEKFISEELEAQGVDEIKETFIREQEIKKITEGLMLGLSFHVQEPLSEIQKRLTNSNRGSVLAGRALRNLIGALGTTSAATVWLGDISGGFEQRQQTGFIPGYNSHNISLGVERHLGSLNMMRAYMNGMKEHRSRILGFNTDMGEIDQPARGGENLSFQAEHNGPILLKKAEPAQEDKIRKEYEMYFGQAQKTEQKLSEEDREKNETKRAELNQEISKIQEQLALFKELEQLVENHPYRYAELSVLNQDIEKTQRLIQDLQRNIAANQPKITQKVPFFGKKVILDEIAETKKQNIQLREQISQQESLLRRYQKMLKLRQLLNGLNEWELQGNLQRAQQKLQYLR